MNINNILNNYIDPNYKKFHQKICKTNYKILGIKIPVLKKISKDLLKKYDYKDILDALDNKTYEHIMLKALITSYANISYEERLLLIDKFIPQIDNWAICDTFCSSLKFINKNKESFLKFVEKYLKSDKEYYLRFGIIVLLDYYLDNNYIDYVLSKMLTIKSDYYYVKMGISWLLSIALIKYYDKTINFLNSNNIDTWIYNKALQKAIESYRISAEKKTILKNMKKN